MSTNVTFNGVVYSIASEGDSNWGSNISNYLIAIATGCLQKTGGAFNLTSEVDFGATFGLKTPYIKSKATNPASAGFLRLGNTETIKWRNAANSGDLDLTVSALDTLQFNGFNVLYVGAGALTNLIVNSDVNAAAAIAYSKLNLSSSIVDADISGSAAIAYSKLNLGTSIVNADINAAAAIAYSKLSLALSIVDGDISSSAAISLSKLAALSLGKVVQTNASTGVLEASAVSNTTLSYLDATSSIQTQIDSKVNKSLYTTTGDILIGSGASNPVRLPIGSNNYILTSNGTTASWQSNNSTVGIGSSITSATSGSSLYVDSTGQLAQDNSNYFWDDTNKRLGIGTGAPGETVHMKKTSGDIAIRMESNAGNMYLVNRPATSTYDLLNAMNGPMVFSTNNSERVRIDASGNFGIGASPSSKLYVSSSINDGIKVSDSTVTGIMIPSGVSTHSFVVGTSSNHPLILGVNNTFPKVTVNTTGNVDIVNNLNVGATATNNLNLNVYGAASTDTGIFMIQNTIIQMWMGARSNNDGRFYFNTGASLGLTGWGQYLANGASGWNTISDERAKDIIEPISNGLDKVNSLRSVIGKFKTDPIDKRRAFLIAQDVLAVLPEAVDMPVNEDDFIGLSYSDVIPLLVASIKELSAKVNSLETRIAAANL
jgi:hypothetical protein